MKKKEFIKIMRELVSLDKDVSNLNKAFKKLEPDFNYISFGRYETLIVNTIKIAVGDEGDWVSYWLYDMEQGKRDLGVWDKDGNKVDIRKLGDLYDWIKE